MHDHYNVSFLCFTRTHKAAQAIGTHAHLSHMSVPERIHSKESKQGSLYKDVNEAF